MIIGSRLLLHTQLESGNMHKTTYGLIWDMDGVLVDSAPLHIRAWQETLLAERNRPFSLDEFHRTFGMRNSEMLVTLLGAEITLAESEHLSFVKETRYRELVGQEGLTLLRGVKSWLDAARYAGWEQAVASSAPRANVEAVADAVNIRSYFSAMIAAEDVLRGKPDPDVFLAAASGMGIAPQHCIVIEDAPVGTEAAHRAGIYCIGVLTTHAELKADVVLPDLASVSFHDVVARHTLLRVN